MDCHHRRRCLWLTNTATKIKINQFVSDAQKTNQPNKRDKNRENRKLNQSTRRID